MTVVGNEGDDALLQLVRIGGRKMGGPVELDRALRILVEHAVEHTSDGQVR